MKKKLLLILAVCLAGLSTPAQCPIKNTAFKSGETLMYDMYFNWKFVWFKVGNATLSTTATIYQGKDAYRTSLITRTSSKADRYFTMRDTLKSYVTHELVPLYYTKRAKEGDRYRTDEVWYSYSGGRNYARMRHRNRKGEIREKNVGRANCIYDMLSIMLRARCMDFSNVKKGFTYRFIMADAGDLHDEKLVFRGRSTFQVEHTSTKYRTLVFSYIEKDDDTGKDVELVRFYITDDKNHLPVRLDMNLKFGTAKAFLIGAHNILNPQTAKVSGK